MSSQLQIVLCCALLLAASVSALPQVWNIGEIPNAGQNQFLPDASIPQPQPDLNNIPSTAAPATQPTPPPAQYFDCLSRCPVTSQYNPVCGSDQVNYANTGRLECAARCGLSVTLVRMGTCRPL